MPTEVFTYEGKYYDGLRDELITNQSEFKVTREYVDARKANNLLVAEYRILEGTKEFVNPSLVIDGRYHPELASTQHDVR